MPRLRFRDKRASSKLEDRFLFLWQIAKGSALEREYRFHAERRWRADFAHLSSRTLIESEGCIYINGRHNRGAGFSANLEKYLEAGLAGCRMRGNSQVRFSVEGPSSAWWDDILILSGLGAAPLTS